MNNKVILFLLTLASFGIKAKDEPFTGWHWYNEQKEQDKTEVLPAPSQSNQESIPDLSKLSPVELKNLMHKYTMESLADSILNPNDIEKTKKFLRWNEYWQKQSSAFSHSVLRAQLDDPSLDYNLTFSHYNGSVPYRKAAEQQEKEKVVAEMAKSYGLFYFFKGADPMHVGLAQTVTGFASRYDIAVIPVSVDGVVPQGINNVRVNHGEAEKINVKAFPALFVVNPKNGEYHPIAYGFISQEDIATRFVQYYNDYKPKY